MSEENIRKLEEECHYLEDGYYVEILENEIKELQQKIDKAIEKVKNISFKFTTDKSWYCVVLSTTTDGKELLKILGDKENE